MEGGGRSGSHGRSESRKKISVPPQAIPPFLLTGPPTGSHLWALRQGVGGAGHTRD